MTNIIKLRFLRAGQPAGREYTYFTPCTVAVGDTVDLEGKQGVVQGVVTQIDVPEAEIAPFKDRAKTITGKVTPPQKTEAVSEKLTAKVVAEYQKRRQDMKPLRAGPYKALGRELRDRFGLTDREAIDLMNGRNELEILAKYEGEENAS